MKFKKEITPKGILLPITAVRLAGLECGDAVEYHALKGAMVVLKGQMTAMELMNAAQSLHKLSAELLAHLALVCGKCDNCGEKDEDSCPLVDLDDEGITLPGYLLQDAGIPEGTKLCAEANEENHHIEIFPAGYDHDLRDVPSELLDLFIASNVCLPELEERLILGDIVYDG